MGGQPPMPFAAAPAGHKLYYELMGSGPVKIMLTMGLGGDHLQWEPQSTYFSQRSDYTVCVYDNRGIGLSEPASGRWTTTAMAQDALAVLDAVGWTQPRSVHLIGLSMGGMITQEIALADVQRFASMALISTIAGGMSSILGFARALPSGGMTLLRTVYAITPQEQLVQGLSLLYPKPFLEEEQMHPTTREPVLNAKAFRKALILRGVEGKKKGIRPFSMLTVWNQAIAVASHCVSTERLAILNAHFEGGKHILVVTGTDDILVHPTNSDALQSGLDCRILRLPGAGHGANEQCAAEVNAALEENIRKANRIAPRL